jgi:hypothetical protein
MIDNQKGDGTITDRGMVSDVCKNRMSIHSEGKSRAELKSKVESPQHRKHLGGMEMILAD